LAHSTPYDDPGKIPPARHLRQPGHDAFNVVRNGRKVGPRLIRLAQRQVVISDPPQIVVVDGHDPSQIARLIDIPVVGPHGLDLDLATGRLFCACDAATLLTLEARSGKIIDRQALSGKPDVVFFNRQHRQLYVAVGDPGVIDVFDTTTMERLATVTTEPGAHTTALAASG
jgi:DNA-binding beta-propeller fold protein YncE